MAASEDGRGRGEEVIHEDGLVQGNAEEVKSTYKSYKKKFKKMKIKFDEKMRQSNELFVNEQLAEAKVAKLAIQNDRILDFLLDMNDSAQMPADKRFDLTTGTPSLNDIPPLITTEELARAAEFNTPAGQAIYNEIQSILSEQATEKANAKPPKSLAVLMASTPHLTYGDPRVSSEAVSAFLPLDDHQEPIGYLSAEAVDDYMYGIDAELGIGASLPTPEDKIPPHQDLALKNPHSVYNWLRRHEPKIFLQDGEGSEKSSGKPGSLRGAGKKASMPAPSKPDALEIVEEDGLGYDPTIGGLEPAKGGKRKRDDDGGYHPKSGTPGSAKTRKPRSKKLKVEGETPAPSSRKRKAKASSPLAIDPDTPGDTA